MAAVRVASVTDCDKPKSSYGKVELSLENCILPPEKTNPTPSLLDGLDRDTEMELRILGCELIQTSGILLRLPQVAMATGQVLFQRFYYSKSFVRHPMEVVSMACVTLASKIEESPRRIRDVVNVFHHIKQVRSGKTMQPLMLDQNYINLKNQVIKAERRVLKELGFCVHVKHPHKIIVTLLEVLKVKNHKIMQTAWNYMNDSLRSEVFVRYHPETVACACIYLSARLLQIPLPSKPAWYLIFGVSEKDINNICRTILSLYYKKKPDPDKLEKIVDELKKSHLEAKLKAKGALNPSPHVTNDHLNFSPSSLPGSPKNGKSPGAGFKKEKDIFKNGDMYLKYIISRDSSHRKKKSLSPVNGSPEKRNRSCSPQSLSSCSPSPRRKQKTPPRGYKDIHRSRSRSRSRSKPRDTKKTKHHASYYKKRSHSPSQSPHSSPHRHGSRKSYKPKSSEKKHKSRSRSHEHIRHASSAHEKSHKSHKEKLKTAHISRAYVRR